MPHRLESAEKFAPKLALPRLYLISPGLHGPAYDLVEAARVAFEAGARLLQVREPHLMDGPLLSLVEALVEVARPHQAQLYVNAGKGAGMRIARKLKLGVHLDAAWPVGGVRKELQGLPVGASAHTPMEVARAVAGRADFVLLSPVLEAPAGSPVPAFGLQGLQTLSRKTPLPLFVMGGVEQKDIPELLSAGAHGIAARAQVFCPSLEGQRISDIDLAPPPDLPWIAAAVSRLLEALAGA